MGMTVYGKTILGMTVTREDFFKSTGTTDKCVGCLKEYKGKPPRHCPECGQKVCRVTVEEPTPAFRNYCQKESCTPEEMWESLTEGDDKDTIWVLEVNSVQSCEDQGIQPLVLGYLLAKINSYNESHKKTEEFDLSEFDGLILEIHKFASELDIPPRPTKLYSCLYLSY